MNIESKELLKIICSCGLQIFILFGLVAAAYTSYNFIDSHWDELASDAKTGFEFIKPFLLKFYEYNWFIFFGWLAANFWACCVNAKINPIDYTKTSLKINILIIYLAIIGVILSILNTIAYLYFTEESGFFHLLGITMSVGCSLMYALLQYDDTKDIRRKLNIQKQEPEQLNFFDLLDEGRK